MGAVQHEPAEGIEPSWDAGTHPPPCWRGAFATRPRRLGSPARMNRPTWAVRRNRVELLHWQQFQSTVPGCLPCRSAPEVTLLGVASFALTLPTLAGLARTSHRPVIWKGPPARAPSLVTRLLASPRGHASLTASGLADAYQQGQYRSRSVATATLSSRRRWGNYGRRVGYRPRHHDSSDALTCGDAFRRPLLGPLRRDHRDYLQPSMAAVTPSVVLMKLVAPARMGSTWLLPA